MKPIGRSDCWICHYRERQRMHHLYVMFFLGVCAWTATVISVHLWWWPC